MQFRLSVRLVALIVALVVLTPTALLLAAPKPVGHACCGTTEGYRLPAQPARCCIVSAPPETQPLGPVANHASASPVVTDHLAAPLGHAGDPHLTGASTVSPSPPRCSSVLRI